MYRKINSAIGNISDKFVEEAIKQPRTVQFKARYVLAPAAAAAAIFAAVSLGGSKAPQNGVSLVGASSSPTGSINDVLNSAAYGEESSAEIPANEYETERVNIENYALPAPAEYTPDISVFLDGMTVEMPEGTPVYAVADGEVSLARFYYTYGRTCQIKLFDGSCARYAHLGEILVSEGEQVSAGQLIGYSGISGYTSVPALYVKLYSADEDWQTEIPTETIFATKWNTMTDAEIYETLSQYKMNCVGEDSGEGCKRCNINELAAISGDGKIVLDYDETNGKVLGLNYYFDEYSAPIDLLADDQEINSQLEIRYEREAQIQTALDDMGEVFEQMEQQGLYFGSRAEIAFVRCEGEEARIAEMLADADGTDIVWEKQDGEQLTLDEYCSLGEDALQRENLEKYERAESDDDIWRFELDDELTLLVGEDYYTFVMPVGDDIGAVVAEVK